MKRALLLAALCLSPGAAHATYYSVDIFGELPDGVTGGRADGFASTNACTAGNCAGGINPVYAFQAQPGDVINFGTLSLSPLVFGTGRDLSYIQWFDENGELHFGSGYSVAFYTGSLAVSEYYTSFMQLNHSPVYSCNSGNPSCYPSMYSREATTPPLQIDLTFTLTYGFIELGWTNPSTYTAPEYVGVAAVPEPSTWAMMILGFVGISCMGIRRRRQGESFTIGCKP